jgi:hypothetical protein
MPYVVTTLHDPAALVDTCQRLGLAAPVEGRFVYGTLEACGWVVRLPSLRFPVTCDTLRGLVAYHPVDNAHAPYGRLTRYLLCCYDAQARLRRRGPGPGRRLPAGQVA